MCSPGLSSGVIASHLLRGHVPPDDRAVLKVLGLKEIVPGEKVRLAVTDGKDRFNAGLIVLDGDEALFLPEKDDIVDFGSGNSENPNLMVEKNGKHIWIVHNFRILGGSFEASAAGSAPSTPSSSTNGLSFPRTPVKRSAENEDQFSNTPQMSSSSSVSSDNKRPFMDGGASTSFSASAGPSTSSNSAVAARRALSFGGGGSAQGLATHQVKDLNPYQNKYTIRVRCTNKGELNERSTSRWQGHVFSVTLQDSTGDIRATGFGEFAKKFFPVFKEGAIFYVSHAQVKPIHNRKFNTTSHNYELGLNQNTVVAECSRPSNDIPKVLYNFIKISDVDSKEEKDSVDVIGKCTAADDTREVTARTSGRQVKKRDITLVDDSGSDIRLTLWGDKAEKFSGLNQVVAVKSATVSDWNGKSLSLSFSGSIEENPDIPQARRIQQWYENADQSALSQLNRTSSNDKSFNSPDSTLGEIKLEFSRPSAASNAAAGAASYYNVEAYLSAVNTDTLSYRACSVCNKKLQEKNGGYFCPKCQRDSDEYKDRYLLRGLLVDATDHQWVSAFDEAGAAIMGMSAADLETLRGNDPAEFQRTVSAVQYSRFLLRVSCKREVYNEENRLKFTVHSAKPVEAGSQDRLERLRMEVQKMELRTN